ncbi:MAG: signal peptidase II [Clostridiaceae bacterium]|jgi:signal peptidase II|nr:signal peptidase II [Clostridiaceae bacterium]
MLWIALIIILTGFDQLSKWYFYTNKLQYNGYVIIKDFFHLTYLENRGAAFGILQNFRWAFILLTIVAVGIMVWYFIKNNNTILRIALTFLISGAMGNFIDRLLRGFVIDFLDFFPFGYDFPIFNFADICVNIGVFVLAFYVLFIYKEPVNDKKSSDFAEVTNEQQD